MRRPRPLRRLLTAVLASLLALGTGYGALAAQQEDGSARLRAAPPGSSAEGTEVERPAAALPGFAPWLAGSLDRTVRSHIAAGASPGAVLVVGHGGEIVLSRGWGRTDWAPDAPPATPETLYDLASLTKVAGTSLAVMILADEGRLELDRPLGHVLPGWPREGESAAVTLRHLLTHSSGLPAGAPFWRRGDDRESWVRALGGLPLSGPPGKSSDYSDLGPILAAWAVEAAAGEPLDAFLARRVYGPLGMERTLFNPAGFGVQGDAVAPTERIGSDLLRGVVHDPSARAVGGVAGNAGLFASARDLGTLASALLWEAPSPVVCRDVLRGFVERGPSSRRFALGWETPPSWSFWSEIFSSRAFGHTGFTGTSLWIDPEQDLFVVLLTNRLNHDENPTRYRALRRDVHDVIRRAHLREEEAARAADWRRRDHWAGVDSCRAARGMEVLRALGDGAVVGLR